MSCEKPSFRQIFLLLCFAVPALALSLTPPPCLTTRKQTTRVQSNHDKSTKSSTQLHLFEQFGKVFEEAGPLGKGITVGKIQVALQCRDRSGIFQELEKAARGSSNSNNSNQESLARLAHTVCLSLLRKSDDWTGACSTSQWFSQKDAGKAESRFNDLANREAAKFEKEYIPDGSMNGGPTLCVVSLLVELQGDETKFDGAGFSLAGTREVLTSLASDVMIGRGSCVNAVELFWTPSDRSEVLTTHDVIIDFPELIDL